MTDWLRLLAMIFYAPVRGMREVRDRGALAPVVGCAYLSQVAYVFATQWLSGDRAFVRNPGAVGSNLFQAATSLLLIAVVLVPLIALVANTLERRGSFRVVLQQEYASLASVAFYALIAANIGAIVIATFFHFSGVQAAHVANSIQQADQVKAFTRNIGRMLGQPTEGLAQVENQFTDPVVIATNFFRTIQLLLLGTGVVGTVRVVFRASVLRAVAITLLSGLAALITFPVWGWLLSRIVASPFLLLMLFFLLRGYFTDIVGHQRARTAFKQNLEAATINPRDSSAHYNLGLIHQQRGELDQARERFQRAIDIDTEELDAHYQLGRIARAQNRLTEAIGHFEQVVQRDQMHAQHEIWREIGATYVAAQQFSDARDALEKFLERRTNDPQGLYLIGRAHAGLGDNQEAASSMQACIEAVKTAPAYKYRTEKRWLNEAQQFIKNSRQEAVSRQ